MMKWSYKYKKKSNSPVKEVSISSKKWEDFIKVVNKVN